MLLNQPHPGKYIINVHEVPNTEQANKYLHVCTWLPTKSTQVKANRLGNYTTWTGLTIKDTNKYFPEADKTQKRHIRQIRLRVISKRENTQVLQPASEGKNINITTKNHYNIYVKLTDMKNTIYNDQTCKLPVSSRRGHKYIMILCEFDSNAILEKPMKNKT